MPDIPQEALQAAEAAYECAYTAGVCHGEIPRIIVEAAAPVLAAQARADERRKVADLLADIDTAFTNLGVCTDPDCDKPVCGWISPALVRRLRAALPEEATTEPQPERTENA